MATEQEVIVIDDDGEKLGNSASLHKTKEITTPVDKKANVKTSDKDSSRKSTKESKKSDQSSEQSRSDRRRSLSRTRRQRRGDSRDRSNHHDRDRDRDSKDKREVCRRFMYSRCDNGAQCKYYHPPKSSRRSPSDSKVRRSSQERDSTSSSKAVCKDFLRSMCSREAECRYYHPSSTDNVRKRKDSICNDYRQGKCLRSECRFIHITRDDEKTYRATGEIPLHVVEQAATKASFNIGTRPICKEFLRGGDCTMSNCRFRHLTRREYEDELYRALQEEFNNVLGPPDVRPNSPQISSLFDTHPNFQDIPIKFNTPHGDLQEELLPPEDMQGLIMPLSEFEPELKRPRYLSGDAMFPVEELRVEAEIQRNLDEPQHMNYDDVERLEYNRGSVNMLRVQDELFAIRNENAELLRIKDREILELKEEVRRALEENSNLHKETAEMRTSAAQVIVQKNTVDHLTRTNTTIMGNLKNAQEAATRLEQEYTEKLRVMEEQHKNNNAQLQNKIDSLQKEIIQLQDALSNTTTAKKKAEEEKTRLLNEVNNMRIKIQDSSSRRKDSQHHHTQRYNERRDQDTRNMGSRGNDRYSPDWGEWDDINGQDNNYKNNRGSATQGDRSRSRLGAATSQAQPPPLMADYQGTDEEYKRLAQIAFMKPSMYSSPGGNGMFNNYSTSPHTPQSGLGNTTGMEGQLGGQGTMNLNDHLYNMSGYNSDVQGGKAGQRQRPSRWQQPNNNKGQNINQSWRR